MLLPQAFAIIQRCIPPFGLYLRNMPHRQTPEHSQQSAFAPSCSIRSGLHSQSNEAQHLPCTALQPWRASFVQQCFRPLVQGNRLHPQQVAFYAVSLHPHSAAFAALHCQSTPSSPHARPALTLASACIRSQMRLSTCPAPHSSPGGLRLCSKCFRPLVQGNRLHPQQVAFYAERLQLHLPLFTSMCRTPALKGFVGTTLRIARRQSTRSSPHSRPAVQFASACIRSQMKLSTCPAPHSSPGGLRLCSKCFRPLVHGNRLHPQQVAFCAERLDLHQTPYR